MATSRSPSEREWTAGAHVFSGRQNPTWPIPEAAANELIALWETLEPPDGPPSQPPALGYRGSFLTDGRGRTWLAYAGAVTLTEAERRTARRDADRSFERKIVESAPPGTLPPWTLVHTA